MPLTFNSILAGSGIDPVTVRLLRHQDNRSLPGRTPYHLWCDDRQAFDFYQSAQAKQRRKILGENNPLWAAFVASPTGETLFAGLWQARCTGLNTKYRQWPHADGGDPAGSALTFDLTPLPNLSDLIGRLIIQWTGGERNWVQYASRSEKPILEIRRVFQEPNFPGYLSFDEPLSAIPGLPPTWRTALAAARGVYILTCPRTREQYIGSATGADGFVGRWDGYVANAHGGNIGLRSRDPSDYRVSILEVVGNAASLNEVVALETLWKRKLRSREMGLNRN
tara:strand:+ start:699 stop:1538 length:840 start_codon:yes stop_codon:yes gene_type:complete